MLYRNKPKKVFLYGKAVDFRKQVNGLATIVDHEFRGELFSGWFVFLSSDKKKVKILYWRETGFALWSLRLEKSLFEMGKPRFTEKKVITWRDLGRLLDGYNIFAGPPHEKIPAKRFS
jgi:transposase